MATRPTAIGDSTCGAAIDISDAPDRKMSRAASELRGDLLAFAMTASSPGGWWTMETGTYEQLWICGAAQPACSSPIQVGDYTRTMHVEGVPGADGMWTEQTGWSFDGKIDGKRLVLSHHDGAHRLVMPDDR